MYVTSNNNLFFIFQLTVLIALATFTLVACSPVAEKTSNKTDTVVSRLNPALRKALLQALNKYDAEATETEETDESNSSSTEQYETSLPEIVKTEDDNNKPIAMLNDQVASVQYHSVVVDSSNVTAGENDNEIIRTIVVKAGDKLSNNNINVDDESVNENRFDAKLDPTKDSNFANTDSLQVARSVGTKIRSNDIEGQSEKSKSPVVKFTTSTTTTTTTTTEAPTHNDDGENIEKVSNDDVTIFQAPLVTAFTIQQDINGQAKGVFPHINEKRTNTQITFIPSQSLPTFDSSIPTVPAPTMQPPVIPAQQFQFNLQQQSFNDINFQQRQQELQQQVLYLQQQQRQQEAIFREQQLILQRQAAQRQEQLLFEQRVRIEEDFKTKQLQYEQELRNYRQQQNDARSNSNNNNNNQFKSQQVTVQQQQFIQAPPLVQQQHQFAPQHQVFVQQLPSLSQQSQFFQSSQPQQQIPKSRPQATSIQIIPSVSFAASFPISTQQLLPSKDFTDFRRTTQGIQFQSKPQSQFSQPQNFFQLNTNQELPQRAFQQFSSQNFNTAGSIPAETQSRNRVFRQETGVGNFGFNNAPNENQQQSNQFLQSLLENSGFAGRQTEDLNIITKVLALNHGISEVNSFTPIDGRRQF